MMRKDHRGIALHPECIKAVENAARLCESLGHVVEEAAPDIDLNTLRPHSQVLLCADVARSLGMRWKLLGRKPDPKDVEALTWSLPRNPSLLVTVAPPANTRMKSPRRVRFTSLT